MKKILYFVSALAIFGIMQSCDKHVEHASKQIVIDTTLASGSEYVLNLRPYGDADDVATLKKQPNAFITSEIVNQVNQFDPVYHFSASAKETQTEQVILAVTEGNHGNGNYHPDRDSTLITINFTIR